MGYFYNINIDTGQLIWAKNQGVPLTSEIKSYSEKIFLLNQDNKFYIFEKNNGKKILDFETFPVILKKNNKQTLALDSRDNLYFVTSAGQVFSLNHQNYNGTTQFIQRPTKHISHLPYWSAKSHRVKNRIVAPNLTII